jgi:3-oxoacyl-[acyl-carrier protein] reductase
MKLGLENRRAVVGGASSGLGSAIAEELAIEGARLLIWSRTQERIEERAAQLRARYDAEVYSLALDASDPTTAGALAAEVKRLWSSADIVVLNSGGPPTVAAASTTPEGWQTALQLLTVTPIAIATALLPGMRAQGHGRIVASLSSGVREPIDSLAYSNSGRSALLAWLKTLARSVAGDGVTVNSVIPGRIATARVDSLDAARAKRSGLHIDDVRRRSWAEIPAGRYGDPADFAAAVAFLASDRASYITGASLACDGGLLRGMP